MSADVEPTVAALDLEAPGVERLLSGVRLVGGLLELAPLPDEPEQLGDLEVDALGGAAGIAVDEDGNVYVADTAADRVLRIGACGDAGAPWSCAEAGDDPGSLRRPRGLAVGPRRALYVADSGNHRIQLFDLATGAVRGVIGQRDPYGRPQAGVADGELTEPWDVAFDADGNLYVTEPENARVQRFDPAGRVDAAFAAAIADGAVKPSRPEYVAIVVLDELEYVLVVDRTGPQRNRLLVYDRDGAFQQQQSQVLLRRLSEAVPGLFAQPPGPLAAGDGVLYLVDVRGGRVVAFDAVGRFLGAVPRYHGAVAGLAIDPRGRLLIHTGAGVPLALSPVGTAASGTFVLGPFRAPRGGDRAIGWQRLEALVTDVPEGAHVRLFALTAATTTVPTAPLPEQAPVGAAALAAEGEWHAAPVDALDFLLANEPAPFLWIGGRLDRGAGGSPRLGVFHASFEREGWLRFLPAVYSREPVTREFLERALAVLETALTEEERLIDDLTVLFDPAAAPDDPDAAWLDWLAGWLAFPLGPALPEARRRALVAAAFELAGRRGTPHGLRQLIRLLLDTEVAILEPLSSVRPWALGAESAALGFATSLAAAEEDGAVLGTSAELDGSHLLDAAERGAPLFGELAHRFCVRAYSSDVATPEARASLVEIVERERPGHTDAHVCVVEPRMRVGFQATIGVDAIVAAGRDQLRLDERGLLGGGAALGGTKYENTGPVVGETARAGNGPRLT